MLGTCGGMSDHQKCQDCGEEAGSDGLCDACRYTRLSAKINPIDLPLFYRLLLKIPGTSRLENASGVFWAIVVPIFIFADLMLNLYLFIDFTFPYNYVLVAVIPTLLFLVFLRIGLERFVNFWNLNFTRSRLDWDVTKLTKDYVNLIRKQGKKKKSKFS
jgi:hypothetical protein